MVEMSRPHNPIFRVDKRIRRIHFIMDAYKVPRMASLANPMACMLAVRGPWM